MAKENDITKLQLVKVVDENLVKTLAYLQSLAMNGDIHGMGATVYSNVHRHKVIVAGKYLDEPHTATRPIKELQELIDEQCKKLEEIQVVKIK